MNKVVKILMERDGMTKKEAENLIEETREMILASSSTYADDIMLDMLGLEPDYIMDIIF